MNELQQVLLVFSVVVIAVLYLLSRRRRVADKPTDSRSKKTDPSLIDRENTQISAPEVTETEAGFNKVEEGDGDNVNLNQDRLSFGEEFDSPKYPKVTSDEVNAIHTPHPATQSTVESEPLEKNLIDSTEVVTEDLNSSAPKHHILTVDDPGMVNDDYQYVVPEYEKPRFGVPDNDPQQASIDRTKSSKKEQVFVIMVMSSTTEFPMKALNHALLGVGLQLSEQNIYVKKDNKGNVTIKVANLLEPGIFPTEHLEQYATPGIAMILELPSTVKAPRVMHDLIMMARKVSQRMEGRLYNMERQLLKESDLQSMRDAAVEYESEPIAL